MPSSAIKFEKCASGGGMAGRRRNVHAVEPQSFTRRAPEAKPVTRLAGGNGSNGFGRGAGRFARVHNFQAEMQPSTNDKPAELEYSCLRCNQCCWKKSS